jgi:hypothetical protein
VALLAMKKLIYLLDKDQLCLGLVHSRLLEYTGVQQEKQLRTELNTNVMLPGKIHKVVDRASFLLADHVRKEFKTCLN